MHLQPYYQKHYGLQPDDLLIANYVSQRLFSLPLYPKMTETDVQDVIAAVRKIAHAYRADPAEAADWLEAQQEVLAR